jgi:ribosomal protein S18 acetylase RimI-like enzyme
VGYRFVNEVPTVEQHGALAMAVGWADSFRWEAMPASLAGSVCGVVVFADGDEKAPSHGESPSHPRTMPVAMGRVVGDGAFYFYVQDVAVHPDHRRQGLGREVVRRLLDQVRERAGGDCFVGLFSTPEAVELYTESGFGAEIMTGMWQVLRPRQRPLAHVRAPSTRPPTSPLHQTSTD